MFLRERSTQAEYCDRPDLSQAELLSVYRQLARLNRFAGTTHLIGTSIANMRSQKNVQVLNLLDLGAGDGFMDHELQRWAHQRGWNWTVTSLDLNPCALGLGTGPRRIAANARALPFADASFDIVFGAQMTHHLHAWQVAEHFSEAWRVTRDALYLLDAHRNLFSLIVLSTFLKFAGFSREFRSDARLSVKRGWRVDEWRRFAAEAGIPNAFVRVEHASRIVLSGLKPGERPA